MDRKQQFENRLPIILAIIRARAKSEERRQNALCWAWYLWPRYADAAESLDQAAKACAEYAARRRQTFGHIGRRGYVDATQRAELAVSIEPTITRDDEPSAAYRIADMPLKLRVFAQLLARGISKTAVARQLGVSADTVTRRCDAIADWLMSHGAIA